MKGHLAIRMKQWHGTSTVKQNHEIRNRCILKHSICRPGEVFLRPGFWNIAGEYQVLVHTYPLSVIYCNIFDSGPLKKEDFSGVFGIFVADWLMKISAEKTVLKVWADRIFFPREIEKRPNEIQYFGAAISAFCKQ